MGANENMTDAIQRSVNEEKNPSPAPAESERHSVESRLTAEGNPKWYTNPGGMPQLLHQAEWQLYKHQERLFDTEKEALDAGRVFAKAEEARWYAVIRSIDARIDAIEESELKAEGL